MYQNPRPAHGFFPLIVASGVYAVLALGTGVLAAELGASGAAAVAFSLVVAVGLLPAFLPLWRRLTPTVGES